MKPHACVVVSLLASCLVVLGCTPAEDAPKEGLKPVGMANPASEHCIHKGGKIEIKKEANGDEYGICHLPDGSSVEEWELFRRDNPPTEPAQPATE